MGNITVVDKETGEIIPMFTNKKVIEEYVSKLSDQEKASVLSKVNLLKKVSGTIETSIRDSIKPLIEYNKEGIFMFENWKIKEVPTTRFSEKLLLEKGVKADILDWYRLKEKYSITTTSPRFS